MSLDRIGYIARFLEQMVIRVVLYSVGMRFAMYAMHIKDFTKYKYLQIFNRNSKTL